MISVPLEIFEYNFSALNPEKIFDENLPRVLS